MPNTDVHGVGRFNAAKTLELLLPSTSAAAFQSRVKPALDAMTADADRDCRFYSARALAGAFPHTVLQALLP